MPDETRTIRTRHGELSLEQIGDALPSTGEIMASVANSWWRCAHAARGGNWALAAHFVGRVRSQQRLLATLRPKYRERLESFERVELAAVLAALQRVDREAFERAFATATDTANRNHVETGHAYIHWVLPDEPPKDLHLGPVREAERA